MCFICGFADAVVQVFCGTVFYESGDAGLQIEHIGWDKEARFKLPIQVWGEMMDHYYPNTARLCLRRDAFDRLSRYKMEHAIPTCEQTIERLIPVVAKPVKEEELAIEGSLPS